MVHGPMEWFQKAFKIVCWCLQFQSEFLAKVHLPRVARQSRLSPNDKCENEMILGAVHISLGIYLISEENQENLNIISDRRDWRDTRGK